MDVLGLGSVVSRSRLAEAVAGSDAAPQAALAVRDAGNVSARCRGLGAGLDYNPHVMGLSYRMYKMKV